MVLFSCSFLFLYITKGKVVKVSWEKVCRPIKEGSLGIRSLSKLNEALNLKLCWDMMISKEQWYAFMRHNRALLGHIDFMCSLCFKSFESTHHLFFECSVSVQIWDWFSNLINLNFHINNTDDLWRICDREVGAANVSWLSLLLSSTL